MSALEDFLQEKAQAGESLGTSAFTLNALKAREKLSRFALPEPGLWIVKMVQAAVAAGADEVRITFLRRKVEIEFANASHWEAEDILRYVSGGALPEERGLAHLVFGLSASAFGPEEQIAWSCGRYQIKLTEDGVEKLVNPDTSKLKVVVTRARKRYSLSESLSFPARYVMKQIAYEYKALIDRCIHCPIPLNIDGHHMVRTCALGTESLQFKPNYDSDNPDGRRFLLSVRPLYLGGEKQLRYPVPEVEWSPGQAYSDDGVHFKIQFWKSDGKPVDALCCIYSVLQRESTLRYVLDGVFLEQKDLFPSDQVDAFALALKRALEDGTDNFAIMIYLESSFAELDLSQFQVREAELGEIHRALLAPLLECFVALRETCRRPWDISVTTTPNPIHTPENWSVAGVGSLAFLSLFIPHALVIGAVGALAYPIYRLAKPSIDHRRANSLYARLDKVIEALEKLAQDAGQES